MKKLSFILALILVSLTCLAVFATGEENGLGAGNHKVVDVNGTYQAGAARVSVYSVDIAWSDLTFVYQESNQHWDPETHSYVLVGSSGWKESDAKITVTNHSNAAILAVPSYQAAVGYEAVTMSFTDGEGNAISSLEVATADNGQNGNPGTPQTGVIKVIPGGALPSGTGEVEIGMITVTINTVGE